MTPSSTHDHFPETNPRHPEHLASCIMSTYFLQIPLEIRLIIYALLLRDNQVVKQRRQPNNHHIRVLHTCRQVYYEANYIFRQYISLSQEGQMLAFCQYATDAQKAQIRHADVANDGRTVENLKSLQVLFKDISDF
jgi:hypothetical protein